MAKLFSKKWWNDIWTGIVDAFSGKKLNDTGQTVVSTLADSNIPIVSPIAQSIENRQDELNAIEREDIAYERSAEEAEKNRQFQREERLAAQEFNVDMWNRSNEYNSYAAQLKRAEQAGINPNAIAGGNSATSSPVTTSPMSGGAASVPSGLASAMINRSAMLDNIRAQTDKTISEKQRLDYDLSYDILTQPQRQAVLALGISQQQKAIEEAASRIGLNNVNKDIMLKTFEWTERFNEIEIQNKFEELNNLRLQNQKLFQEIENLEQQEELLRAQTEGQQINNAIQEVAKKFCEITGIPIGTDQFSLAFYLFKSGEYETLTQDIITKGAGTFFNVIGNHPITQGIRTFATDLIGEDNFNSAVNTGKRVFKKVTGYFDSRNSSDSYKGRNFYKDVGTFYDRAKSFFKKRF